MDSSIIFDTLNGKRGRQESLSNLLAQGNFLACCPINITEVYSGLRDHEKPATDACLKSSECYSLTLEVAQLASLLQREWRQKGHTLSFTDVSLAAVAIQNKLPFLTDNRKHFLMPELRLYPLP